MSALFLAVLTALTSAVPVYAQSSVEEARALYGSYHEDLSRLDRVRDFLEKRLTVDPQVEHMIFLSRVYYTWGDVRAKEADEKLSAYERGREIGRRAVELAPRNPEAHFWYAVNTGRFGQTKGVLRSLFLLPTMKEELTIIFELAPKHAGAHGLAGNFYAEVPGLFGGDSEKAEEYFKKGIELDPRQTAIRVDYAKFLIKRGRHDEARRQLRRVLDEKNPANPADWAAKHKPKARELLDSLKATR
jgi:tetratricopeptide (TPR) repeat protein